MYSAAFSPDGTRIVTASRDHSAIIWAAATTEEVAAWEEQEAYAVPPAP